MSPKRSPAPDQHGRPDSIHQSAAALLAAVLPGQRALRNRKWLSNGLPGARCRLRFAVRNRCVTAQPLCGQTAALSMGDRCPLRQQATARMAARSPGLCARFAVLVSATANADNAARSLLMKSIPIPVDNFLGKCLVSGIFPSLAKRAGCSSGGLFPDCQLRGQRTESQYGGT